MVTPHRRRIAVGRIQERFGVSERRAGAVVARHRSTRRRAKAAPSCAEAELREHLRDFARCHPRLGGRKAHVVAHREGLVTNPKRTRRIWRNERPSDGPSAAASQTAPPHGCAPSAPTTCGPSIPASTRPPICATSNCSTSSTGSPERPWPSTPPTASTPTASSPPSSSSSPSAAPQLTSGWTTAHLRMDNGPEPVSAALRDWCRIWGHPHRLHRARIPLGEPLHRVLQRAPPRRMPQHRGLR